MGNIGDSLSTTAPAVGASGPGFATTINSLLTEVRARLIAKIPLSSLLTNSNLDLNGQALLNAAYITLANESVSPVASPVNRVAAYQGDFWWVSPSGPIQITNGAALNAAGVGGITGDYSGAGPMEFRYDLANTRYDAFANQSTNTWAYIRALGFDIAGGATSNNRLRFTSDVSSNESLNWTTSSTDDGVLQVSGSNVVTGPVSLDTQAYFVEHYKTYSAMELFTRGYFSGAGTGAIAFDGNSVPYYRLSTAGGYVQIQLLVDNETTTTNGENTLLLTAIKWKGKINGGGYPTLNVALQDSGRPVFNVTAPSASNQTLSAQTTATGAMQTVFQSLDTPLELLGDELIYLTVLAGTNNCDTYSITAYLTKQT